MGRPNRLSLAPRIEYLCLPRQRFQATAVLPAPLDTCPMKCATYFIGDSQKLSVTDLTGVANSALIISMLMFALSAKISTSDLPDASFPRRKIFLTLMMIV
jgi:hypothetical protein